MRRSSRESAIYPNSSRLHSRGTEIFETASVREPAPAHGWLGRYLDHQPVRVRRGSAGRPPVRRRRRPHARIVIRTQPVGCPSAAASRHALDDRSGARDRFPNRPARLSPAGRESLGAAARRLGQATSGSGSRFDYPDSEFGQALRWTGNLIETGSPTRVYYLTLGSFATFTSPSFDTHSNQLAVHQVLYSQFGAGLRAFAAHLRAANQFQRVLLLSFSEFGRQGIRPPFEVVL